jgi:hypothetical protein
LLARSFVGGGEQVLFAREGLAAALNALYSPTVIDLDQVPVRRSHAIAARVRTLPGR